MNKTPMMVPPASRAFDVIVPVAMKDAGNLRLCVKNISASIKPDKIVVIANARLRSFVESMNDTEFCDGDDLMANLSLARINELMKSITGTPERGG
jgi:hypothetical protein